MPYHTPSYTFITNGAVRSFHHRWLLNGEIHECDACHSICHTKEPYSNHWPRNALTSLLLSVSQRSQLAAINYNKISSFLLCDKRVMAAGSTREFLLDAGINSVPSLLRLMFYEADRIEVKLLFYVRIAQEDFIFQSSELSVEHHYDIGESVDVIFFMLLEKIKRYASVMDYQVRRMRIDVERTNRTCRGAQMSLPLQYRVKNAILEDEQRVEGHFSDIKVITNAYMHRGHGQRALLTTALTKINLYSFQICRNSHELFVVPHHLSAVQAFKDTRSFIRLDDVAGRFQQLREISHVRRFLRHDAADRVLTCRVCHMKFVQQTQLTLHKMLQCGRAFEVLQIAGDAVEIYEKCLELPCDSNEWTMYGIIQ